MDMEYANRKRTTRREAFLDAIYDSYAMKHFLKIDFSTEQTPRCHDISVLSSPARKARHHPQDIR